MCLNVYVFFRYKKVAFSVNIIILIMKLSTLGPYFNIKMDLLFLKISKRDGVTTFRKVNF